MVAVPTAPVPVAVLVEVVIVELLKGTVVEELDGAAVVEEARELEDWARASGRAAATRSVYFILIFGWGLNECR
jgi:hypothetical protein